ncbi:platelet-derived growth factor subunit A-like isoform X1 [Athalia rosae]|uniref:platelet-derived growth factor subunit A-like isoform X1 n=1 Tax=Athalia rosae TaxID=37344 RepID=UPI002033B950|nr:platelet-derived growth factor subunit A-like isoform X1 [Athalia rosae]XP_048515093.1 platelet-derived growth factor subunit A-like isoform X1 [Athalia rosae]XP_048515094.1 platelet-derived growth factor subunit A-like isoform X1 [Athalia rosae]XP_048515095.1 platelet-derived growth factor subunit A-like isoform X1 [Athalia rosae]XP_048515096.1 platelet-derived growth factor subunit A-like isoform X1 [Athalia rosae]
MPELSFSKKLVIFLFIFGSTCGDDDENDDRIIFSESGEYGTSRIGGKSELEMSLELAREYSQIESVEDFLKLIQGVPEGEILTGVSFENRFGEGRSSNVEIGKPAICSPELQPVPLKPEGVDPSALYFPSCTRVPRCGGCCGHILYSCQPTATITRRFQVLVAEMNHVTGTTYKRKEIVPIEEHTKCRCQCKVKAEDCNERQVYNPRECRCACSNVDEETKCQRNNATKRWDVDSCTCQCRGSHECSTGAYYDHSSCSCKNLGTGGHRRHAISDYGKHSGFGSANSRQSSAPNSATKLLAATLTIDANDPRRRHKEDPE